MAVYKRGSIWWIYLVAPDGKKIRRSSESEDKEYALKLHDVVKAELIKAPNRFLKGEQTWEQAGKRWLLESKHKASCHTDKLVVALFNEQIGKKKLRDITNDVVQQVMNSKAEEFKPATINRYLEIVRAILRKAENEWEWLDRAPHISMRKVENRRVRYLTPEQASRLLQELPEHQRHFAEFALLTGLRQRNIMQLRWSQVDLQHAIAWIHPDESKTRKAIAVPLNERAVALLQSLQGQHEEFVFTYKGHPVTIINTRAWRKALKRVGIEDFRWHDLRHTWATWHLQNGTPIHALQELGGWSSYEMVRRYAHLSAAHLLDYSRNVGDLVKQPTL